MSSHEHLNAFRKEFEVTTEKMQAIARSFKKTVVDGLKKEASPLKMLSSYIGRATGDEKGIFYTVDMGGTNIRSAKFEIGNRSFKGLGEVKSKLRDPEGKIDYTGETANGEMLFDFFAENIAKLAQPSESGYLGHTFSFPSRQTGINEAYLLEWTKEIKTPGVVGENPNVLLQEALKRKNMNIEPVAIINDTVGTLLVAQYLFGNADIGVIMGTGHNTCYLEKNHPLTGGEMIVNMESGNFNIGLPVTSFDQTIDHNSVNPGAQWLEKMVSGYYIGEIARLVVEDFFEKGVLFAGNKGNIDYFRNNRIDSLVVEKFILYPGETVQSVGCTPEDAEVLQEISRAIVRRAARLVAATLVGTLWHIDGEEISVSHVIAVDGTFYEKMPGVPEMMQEAMTEVFGEKADLISFKLVKDGSGLGAAIAAAVAVSGKR